MTFTLSCYLMNYAGLCLWPLLICNLKFVLKFLPSSNSPWSEGGEQNYSEIFTPTFIGDNLGQINTDF